MRRAFNLPRTLASALCACLLLLASNAAEAGARLDAIKQRGFLTCGVGARVEVAAGIGVGASVAASAAVGGTWVGVAVGRGVEGTHARVAMINAARASANLRVMVLLRLPSSG